jgi:hypothetical protein
MTKMNVETLSISGVLAMTRSMFLSAAFAALLAQGAVASPIVGNFGFEDPVIVSTAYTTPFGALPTSLPSWTFAASEGGVTNGSYDGYYRVSSGNFQSLTGLPPGSQQVAFLEVLGSFSQIISGFDQSPITVSFYAGGRNLAGYGANGVQVKIDDTLLTFAGASTLTPVDGIMNLYTSDAIRVSAGSHTLSFYGMDHADHMSFIDNVSITVVPEPSTLGLLGVGLLGLPVYAWRRRRRANRRPKRGAKPGNPLSTQADCVRTT